MKMGGPLLKNWKRRYFVVDSTKMEVSYYVEAADHVSRKDPQGKFSLLNYVVSADAIKENSFKLSGLGCRTHFMQAESPQEQQQWINKLRQLLQTTSTSQLAVVDEDHEVEDFSGGGPRPGGKVSMEDFEMKKVIGRGAFGKVMLVQKKSDGQLYAMKILSKDMILRTKQVKRAYSENQVLRKIDHPYLVGMKYAFQTETKLCLVLDFVNGGDMFGHLQQVKRFSVDQVRLYAAEMVLAFEHLHSLNIVYRDLKPENILICFDGHLKLTDFGLVKESMVTDSKTSSFCGTPEYLAPEVIAGDKKNPSRYGKDVDWWALGILMFEMLTGRSPFFHDELLSMYNMIMHQPLEVQLGKIKSFIEIPPELEAILHAFLAKEPRERLGFGPEDAKPIKAHAFFASINWALLERREIPSPYKPKVKNAMDTSNFDEQFTSEVHAQHVFSFVWFCCMLDCVAGARHASSCQSPERAWFGTFCCGSRVLAHPTNNTHACDLFFMVQVAKIIASAGASPQDKDQPLPPPNLLALFYSGANTSP
jgi:serine/threonine protein kinase